MNNLISGLYVIKVSIYNYYCLIYKKDIYLFLLVCSLIPNKIVTVSLIMLPVVLSVDSLSKVALSIVTFLTILHTGLIYF